MAMHASQVNHGGQQKQPEAGGPDQQPTASSNQLPLTCLNQGHSAGPSINCSDHYFSLQAGWQSQNRLESKVTGWRTMMRVFSSEVNQDRSCSNSITQYIPNERVTQAAAKECLTCSSTMCASLPRKTCSSPAWRLQTAKCSSSRQTWPQVQHLPVCDVSLL